MMRDWSYAYDNLIHIPDVDKIMVDWAEKAAKYRKEISAKGLAKLDQSYGQKPQETYDVFLPQEQAKGIAIYIHGGYWKAGDKSSYSHMMQAFTAYGFLGITVNYPLCPDVTIPEIAHSVAKAVNHIADTFDGPIYLIGHSAGGHLITRMVCGDELLDQNAAKRIKRLLGISGLYDLRPVAKTDMNEKLHLSEGDCMAHSAALLTPRNDIDVMCIVGGEERTELVRQTRLLANIWSGFDLTIHDEVVAGCHHLSIVEQVLDKNHPVLRAFLS